MLKLGALGVSALALVAFVGGASGQPAAAPESLRTVTVTGTGTVAAVPDRAQFGFGVSSTATTATQALQANATEMRKVIDALKAAGIAAKDIQTQAVSLNPRYSENGDEIIGYVASNVVAATLTNLDRAGQIIDAAVGAGANQVSGPALTRSDSNALYRQALRAAIANARLKARTIASAGHARLGRIRTVTESSVPPPTAALGASKDSGSSTPIEPGTQLIEANVTVQFALG